MYRRWFICGAWRRLYHLLTFLAFSVYPEWQAEFIIVHTLTLSLHYGGWPIVWISGYSWTRVINWRERGSGDSEKVKEAGEKWGLVGGKVTVAWPRCLLCFCSVRGVVCVFMSHCFPPTFSYRYIVQFTWVLLYREWLRSWWYSGWLA